MPDFYIQIGDKSHRFRDPHGLLNLLSSFLMANGKYTSKAQMILTLMKIEFDRISDLRKTKEGRAKFIKIILEKLRKEEMKKVKSSIKEDAFELYSVSNLSSRILDMLSRSDIDINEIIKFRNNSLKLSEFSKTNKKGWKALKKLKKKDFISTREKIVELMNRSFGSRKMIVRMGFQKIEQSKTKGPYDDFKKPPRKIEKK